MANYIIIAATSEIGGDLITKLSDAGHSLYLTGRDESRLKDIADKVGCDHFQTLNADDFAAVDEAFGKAEETIGRLDGAVCLAGSVILKPAHLTSPQEFADTMKANIEPAFATVRAAGKHIKSGGSVVLLGTAAAMQGISNHEAIAAAKGAVIALAQSAAATYSGQNLRFNTVCPGLTQTRLTQKLTANETSKSYSQAMHALGCLGETHHIANMIEFLLNPENNWITGQTFAVDGGLSRVMPKVKP